MINGVNVFGLLIAFGIIFIILVILFIFCACIAASKDSRFREELENNKLYDNEENEE